MIYKDLSAINPLVHIQVGVAAEIVLGSPKKDCRGIGICRIDRPGAITAIAKSTGQRNTCPPAKALLCAKTEDTLYLYFIKHSLPACCFKKQFNRGQFKITEAVTLPLDMSVELGLRRNSVIQPGTYRVADLGTHISIAVRVKAADCLAASQH